MNPITRRLISGANKTIVRLRAERDQARSIAVRLEQENAYLEAENQRLTEHCQLLREDIQHVELTR